MNAFERAANQRQALRNIAKRKVRGDLNPVGPRRLPHGQGDGSLVAQFYY
jgi:hypothetical protein